MNNKIVNINEYVIIMIYIKRIIDGRERSACLIMKVHVINNLKVNIFINTNIMTF